MTSFSSAVSVLKGLTEKEKELLIALREKTSSDTSIDLALNTLVVLSGSLSRSEESEKLLERPLMYREDQDSQKYEVCVLEFGLQNLKNKWKECLQRKKRLDVDEEKIEDKRSVTKKRPSACSPRGVRPRRRELSVKSTCRDQDGFSRVIGGIEVYVVFERVVFECENITRIIIFSKSLVLSLFSKLIRKFVNSFVNSE